MQTPRLHEGAGMSDTKATERPTRDFRREDFEASFLEEWEAYWRQLRSPATPEVTIKWSDAGAQCSAAPGVHFQVISEDLVRLPELVRNDPVLVALVAVAIGDGFKAIVRKVTERIRHRYAVDVHECALSTPQPDVPSERGAGLTRLTISACPEFELVAEALDRQLPEQAAAEPAPPEARDQVELDSEDEEAEVELDYAAVERRCRSASAPPAPVAPPPPARSYSQLFSQAYVLAEEEEAEEL